MCGWTMSAAVPPGEVRAALFGLTVRQVGVLEAAAVAVAPDRECCGGGQDAGRQDGVMGDNVDKSRPAVLHGCGV